MNLKFTRPHKRETYHCDRQTKYGVCGKDITSADAFFRSNNGNNGVRRMCVNCVIGGTGLERYSFTSTDDRQEAIKFITSN